MRERTFIPVWACLSLNIWSLLWIMRLVLWSSKALMTPDCENSRNDKRLYMTNIRGSLWRVTNPCLGEPTWVFWVFCFHNKIHNQSTPKKPVEVLMSESTIQSKKRTPWFSMTRTGDPGIMTIFYEVFSQCWFYALLELDTFIFFFSFVCPNTR